MSRYAIVENGVVTNIVVAEDMDFFDKGVTVVQSDDARIGWTYSQDTFSEPSTVYTDEQLAVAARAKRDALIAETDYMFRSDYPISANDLGLFKIYSQLLRDIPNQIGFPTSIDWPEKPIISNRQ